MKIVRIVVGVLVIVAIGVSIAWSFSSGRARLAGEDGGAPAPFPDDPAIPHSQIEQLAVSADTLQPLSPEEARDWNKALPFSDDAVSPAPRFMAPVNTSTDYQRALDCLTAAVYYEAGQEAVDGKLAVAQVVLNRVRHPAYPKTVCGVVFEGAERRTGCQFTFTCDGALARLPTAAGWAGATAIAEAALNGLVSSRVGAATHYHANYVAPYWAPRLSKLAEVGAHIFYRFPGSWSAPSALRNPYRGGEPAIAKMAHLSRAVVETPLSIDESLVGAAPPAPEIRVDMIDPAPIVVQPRPAEAVSAPANTGPQPDAPAPVQTPPPVVQNPLTADPAQPRRNRIARPERW